MNPPEPFATCKIDNEEFFARKSSSDVDEDWDAFLQSLPTGHFQQSSIWGTLKASEDWTVLRIVVWKTASIQGGFQLLVRRRWLFREAFLNKGPVLINSNPDLAAWLFELIELTLKSESIHLLLAQPPDADSLVDALFGKFGYQPNGLGKIITATFSIPLGPELPSFDSRMRRSIRLEARQARKRGLKVKVGQESDIPVFFQLMSASAQRQRSQPNPANEAALLNLWRSFQRRGLSRLTIAEDEGRPVAGLLTIRFGTRVTQWKKGWAGESREKHPNTLLAVESVEWAQETGAQLVDFGGGNREFVRALLSNTKPTETQRQSRDFYLVGLGADPVLLPLARVRLRNPFARIAYALALSLPLLRKRVER